MDNHQPDEHQFLELTEGDNQYRLECCGAYIAIKRSESGGEYQPYAMLNLEKSTFVRILNGEQAEMLRQQTLERLRELVARNEKGLTPLSEVENMLSEPVG